MNRLKVLQQINDLENARKTASPKQQEEIDEQIRKLGEKLTLPRRAKKIEEIKQKGSQMTYADVEFLRNQDFTLDEISKWIGMTRAKLSEFIKAHNGEVKEVERTKEVREWGKGNIEEGKRLLKETDLSIPKIAEMTGCTTANLYYHSRKIRGQKKNEEPKRTVMTENLQVMSKDEHMKHHRKEQPKTKADLHQEIITKMHEIYQSKNKDYGDSFGKQFNEYGIVSSAIRIEDKFQRFKNLIKNEAEVKDETIEDTLLDMANYCVMTLVELENRT